MGDDGPALRSQPALRRGLDAVQARHPFLRLAIVDDDGLDPRWVPTDRPIPLRHVRREHDDQWVREINERELLDRVDPATGPLARAVVISGDDDVHDLLVVVPHIIADGTTVITLAQQWLELAADGAEVESYRELPPPDELRPARHTGEEGATRLAEQTARDEELMARTKPGRVEPTTRVPLVLIADADAGSCGLAFAPCIVFATGTAERMPASGAPCRIRTDDPRFTRAVLWPTELRRRTG